MYVWSLYSQHTRLKVISDMHCTNCCGPSGPDIHMEFAVCISYNVSSRRHFSKFDQSADSTVFTKCLLCNLWTSAFSFLLRIISGTFQICRNNYLKKAKM